MNLTDDSMWIMTMMMLGWDYYDSAHSATCLYLLFTVGKFLLLHLHGRVFRVSSAWVSSVPGKTSTHMAKSADRQRCWRYMSNMQRIEWIAFDWLCHQKLVAKCSERVQGTHTNTHPHTHTNTHQFIRNRKKETYKQKCCWTWLPVVYTFYLLAKINMSGDKKRKSL